MTANHMTNPFYNGASFSLWVLGAERKALNPGGEIKLTHLLTQAAVGHVRLGGQVNWCFYRDHNINHMNTHLTFEKVGVSDWS